MSHVALLVEGMLDEAVGRRIVQEAGGRVSVTYGKRGVGYIKNKIAGFNNMAQGVPLLALVDLMDTRIPCPVTVVERWLPSREKRMIFRVVVREIESWLIADRVNLASFLRVARKRIPRNPEELDDPKRKLINLARRSQSTEIQRLLVPNEDSTATEGIGYTSKLQQFVYNQWDPDAAAQRAPSLQRCRQAIRQFIP